MNLAERPKQVQDASFTERRAKLAITAASPDRTVTARSSHRDGVVVELAPGCIERHTVESLAGQIRAAVNGAVSGYRKGIGIVLGSGDRTGAQAARRAADPRRAELDEAIAAITVTEVSRDNDVTITWRGGEIDVRLRRGCLARYVEYQLARSVTETLASGARRFAHEVGRAHESARRHR